MHAVMIRGEMEYEFSDSGEGGQFQATGKVVTFLRQHLAKGEIDQAVALYESCVENVADSLMLEFKSASKVMQKAMANMFYRARDYRRAAVACETIGEWGAAAKAYEASLVWDKAAACFLKAGNKQKAAAMLQKAGDPRRAAELFFESNDPGAAAQALEAAGDKLGAAQLVLRSGDKKKAAQLLAQVLPGDPAYLQAAAVLADVLVDLGRRDLAIQVLAKAMPRDRKIKDNATAELAYKAGLLLAANSQPTEAATAFEMVRVFDPKFKDVAQRLVAMTQDAATVPAGIPPSSTGKAVRVAPATTGGAMVAPKTSSDPFAALDGNPFGVSRPGGNVNATGEIEVPNTGFVTRMQGYELLKTLPIFEDLSLDEMKDFYNLCEQATFAAGDVLIEQGQPGQALYIIREGNIGVFNVEGGREVPIVKLGSGTYVGEMALIDDAPTSARVKAMDEVKVFRIRKDVFRNYLYTHDLVAMRVYRSFTRTLVERLRDTTARVKK